MNIAYIRVSTKEQNTDRQFDAFKAKNIEIQKVYEEKTSGKDTKRKELNAMIEFAREGDTIYIEAISRLARSTRDFLNIVDKLSNKNVGLVSLKESIDTTSAQGTFQMTLFAALAELERANIRERQREGIESAISRGKHCGRPPLKVPDNFKLEYDNWQAGRITAIEAMRRTGLKRNSFYKLAKIEAEKQAPQNLAKAQ